MHKKIFTWAAFFGMLAVALGAFGAHAIKARIPATIMEAYQTGVQYNFYHALAMMATGLLYRAYRHINIAGAALFFGLGIVFFSGSLYAYGFSGLTTDGASKFFARITPVGGVFFILGWLCLLYYFITNAGKNVSTTRSKTQDQED